MCWITVFICIGKWEINQGNVVDTCWFKFDMHFVLLRKSKAFWDTLERKSQNFKPAGRTVHYLGLVINSCLVPAHVILVIIPF